MFQRLAVAAALFVEIVGLVASPCRAEDKADPKKLEAMMEKALEGYNKDDVKAFFADFAKSVEVIATEATYDALYKQGAKKDVGNYVAKSLKLRKEGSVLEGEVLLVYFDAEFANAKQGQIAANFQLEGGAYKFIQVQLSKKP